MLHGAAVVSAVASLLGLGGSFSEPEIPAPTPLSIPAGQPGERFQVNFPPAAHGGESRGTYWLTGKEPLLLDLQLSADVDRGAPLRIGGTFVVDGLQSRIRVDRGKPQMTFERTLTPGEVEHVVITVAPDRIPQGVHWGALLLWQADGSRFPGWGFTIVKDAPAPQWSAAPDPYVRRARAVDDATTVRLESPSSRLMFGPPAPVPPGADGSATFAVHLAGTGRPGPPTNAEVVSHTLVALVDGVQRRFGWTMWAPTVDLDGSESADAKLTVRALPADKRRHHVLLFLVTRTSPSAEGVAGAAWQVIPPRQLGGLTW